ncbi:MAG: 50S ribosomal protein L1 [Verrucomicrobiota bacterium]
MAKKRSKRYAKAAKMVDENKLYPLNDAVALVKKFPATKFDATVTLSFKLGVDPRQSDQMVRGACALPHGSGSEVRVAVFAEGEAAIAAKNAGAEHVGMDDLIKKVKDGFTDFDVAVATPAAMAEVRKLGRVLGPRGLMPNPKTGTVTDDTAKAIAEVKAGRIDFKVDKNSNVAMRVGKLSFSEEQLLDNAKAAVEAVSGQRPASAKGVFMQSVTIAATMTPGVHLDAGAFNKST